jgi:hypothetical protein
MGLRYASEHPMARGKAHAWIGIVPGGLFGLLWLVVTVLIAISALGQAD